MPNMNDEEEEDLLRQEIEELTDMLRNDETWHNLRAILQEKGFDPETTLLVLFMEDDENHEFGVLVTSEGRVIEYQRDTTSDDAASFQGIDITNDPARLEEYPQVAIALAEFL
jgi:hypothetical protein